MGPVDALGNEIVYGMMYAYSITRGSRARTVIGLVLHITEAHKVTIKVIKTQRFLYGKLIKDSNIETAVTSTVCSHLLFPLPPQNVQEYTLKGMISHG